MRIPKIKLPESVISSASLAIIGAGAILIIAGVIYYDQQAEQKRAIDKQTSVTNELILKVKAISEQNVELSKQNKEINEQNRNYAYCNASVLAKYTQDLMPIIIDDLNKCLFTSYPRETATGFNGYIYLNPTPTLPNGKPVPDNNKH